LFGSSIGMVVQNTIDEEYVDVSKIIPQLRDRSEYAIAVNPKYMIDCMKAMKDHKSVVLNFGGPIQSIMITPNGPREGTQTGLLLPMRIYNESI
jgi:DNA polymerase III sliding clamp (beta) subunit (PCNA family)